MSKYKTKINNSLNLPCHTNTLYEIESTEDLLKVDYNKYDELLIVGECTNLVLPTRLNKKVIKSKNEYNLYSFNPLIENVEFDVNILNFL